MKRKRRKFTFRNERNINLGNENFIFFYDSRKILCNHHLMLNITLKCWFFYELPHPKKNMKYKIRVEFQFHQIDIRNIQSDERRRGKRWWNCKYLTFKKEMNLILSPTNNNFLYLSLSLSTRQNNHQQSEKLKFKCFVVWWWWWCILCETTQTQTRVDNKE